MRVYTNSLGITCVEPAKGYLLKKNGETYKKVYLGINDRAELYEEVIDANYVFTEDEINDFMNDTFDEFYPVNPALEPIKEVIRQKTMKEFDIYEPYPGFMEEQGISEANMWAGIVANWWETYIWEAIARWSPRAGDSRYFTSLALY